MDRTGSPENQNNIGTSRSPRVGMKSGRSVKRSVRTLSPGQCQASVVSPISIGGRYYFPLQKPITTFRSFTPSWGCFCQEIKPVGVDYAWSSALHLGWWRLACPFTRGNPTQIVEKHSRFSILCMVMITIAWKNKRTTHGLACLENVKTSTKRTGNAHNRRDHPPTHAQGIRFPLSFYFSILYTLLAYSSARRIPFLWLLVPRVHPKAVWLHAAALDAVRFCPCATVLKAQQTMKWTNGRLMFGEINNVAIKVTIAV